MSKWTQFDYLERCAVCEKALRAVCEQGSVEQWPVSMYDPTNKDELQAISICLGPLYLIGLVYLLLLVFALLRFCLGDEHGKKV